VKREKKVVFSRRRVIHAPIGTTLFFYVVYTLLSPRVVSILYVRPSRVVVEDGVVG